MRKAADVTSIREAPLVREHEGHDISRCNEVVAYIACAFLMED